MISIQEPNTIIYEVERSQFIGVVFPCDSLESIQIHLKELRRKHPKATHHCYAYRLQLGLEKQSDDGEPSGTAGAPLLASLRQHNLQNVLVVVVRYFGGIKLGTGGLTRAYRECAERTLATAIRRYRAKLSHIEIASDHSDFQKLLYEAEQLPCLILSRHYDYLPPSLELACEDSLIEYLQDFFHYRLKVTVMPPDEFDVPENLYQQLVSSKKG